MKDLLPIVAHSLTTFANLLEPGGVSHRRRQRSHESATADHKSVMSTCAHSLCTQSIPRRAGINDASSHNLRKTFATRLLSRGAAITDVQNLLGHASVKTTEKAYAAFVKNEGFKQMIDLLNKPVVPKLTVVT